MLTLVVPRAFFTDEMDMQQAQQLNNLYRERRFNDFNNAQACKEEKQQGVPVSEDDPDHLFKSHCP